MLVAEKSPILPKKQNKKSLPEVLDAARCAHQEQENRERLQADGLSTRSPYQVQTADMFPPTNKQKKKKKTLCAQEWSRRRTNTTDRQCCAIISLEPPQGSAAEARDFQQELG